MKNNTIAGLDIEKLKEISIQEFGNDNFDSLQKVACMIASAHCAKISYNNHGKGVDYQKDIELYKRLKRDMHMSPFEHVAKAMNEYEYKSYQKKRPSKDGIGSFGEKGWCRNFKGFIQLRETIEQNE